MSGQQTKISQLPQKTSAKSTDVVLFLANTGSNTAQTASISIGTLLSNTANLSIDASYLNFSNVPTSDPHNVGTLWSNAGILTISAG